MMASLKTVVWNCASLRTGAVRSQDKALYFEKEYKKSFQVAFFVETHHRSRTDITPEILRYQTDYHIVHSPVSGIETHAGIIGLISKKYDIIEEKELLPGRILNVRIKGVNDKFEHNLNAVYLETNNKLTRDKMANVISLIKGEIRGHVNNMILGDFNFIDHKKDKAKGLNPTDKLIENIWIPFLAEVDMIDPFREQNPKRKIWSFIGNGAAANSRIDRFYVDSVDTNNCTNIQYVQTPFGGHKVLSFFKNSSNDRGKGYYKMNTSILLDSKFQDIVLETLREVESLETDDDIHNWVTFTTAIKSKAIIYSQHKNSIKNNLKKYVLKEISRIEDHEASNGTLKAHLVFLQGKLKLLEQGEIEGYKLRIKFLPTFEKDEPDIEFLSKVEDRKKAQETISQLAEKPNGQIFTNRNDIMRISTDFYKSLYTPNRVDTVKQDRLLRNVKTKLSHDNQRILDAMLSIDELKNAVFGLNTGKSPGLDGIPIEFYQQFWEYIKHLYFRFINKIRTQAFPSGKNTSVIKLIYKKKGEIFLLTNYRPISLINVDVKILCKALANRLKPILPSIIHSSQTAVFGRRIDHTIHTIRDLIDLANKEDDTAAFIFLDQEKAFDRVNHDFLFKTMHSFGFGKNFIEWIKMIYSNASSVLNINGFFSGKILLKRGVRQGCPLSAFLYVLVMEVFAIQLRTNPNIVGFNIEGEKIVSAHYMDDTTIIIKQNRCFKEVIKELTDYEEASGAKVNYDKTKGLWTGSWKNRRVTPMGIKWTSENVFNLGVYLGNCNPAQATFDKIIPRVRQRLHYWKHFTLTQLGKARAAEIFAVSRCLYATRFYTFPPSMRIDLQKEIFNYVNFPRKVITISQTEMQKLKTQGGIKLLNLEVKSVAPKVKWLIEMVSQENLKQNLAIFTALIGIQKGNISGKDIVFLRSEYMRNNLKTDNVFYREALLAISRYNTLKGINSLTDWDKEHIFYNPLFLSKSGKTLKLTKFCEEREIFYFDQLLEEKIKLVRNQTVRKPLIKISDQLVLQLTNRFDILTLVNGDVVPFTGVTEKIIYEEAIMQRFRTHHSQEKWANELGLPFVWEDVWTSVHHQLSLNETIDVIWRQIHLNFYTQYSYNKWHNTNGVCPLCHQVPQNIFHIILYCNTVTSIWNDVEPVLIRLHNVPVSNEEKAFGIVKKKPSNGVLARNWVTFLMRQVISDVERLAHYAAIPVSDIKHRIQEKFRSDVQMGFFRSDQGNHLSSFQEVITHNGVLSRRPRHGDLSISELFPP